MNTKIKKLITTAQIKALHAMLNKYGLLEYKHEYIRDITNGRTESAKELTQEEAGFFFTWFNKNVDTSVEDERRKTYFKAIWKIAWDLGIIYGDSDEDFEMNKAKLNQFCRDRGTVKKNITIMDSLELRKTQRQFEAILHKHNKRTDK